MKFLPRPVDLLNKSVPASGLVITRDVAYGQGAREKLDVYRPAAARGKLPVIVFFYGGSWQWGAKGDYRFAAATLARQGFVVAVPDYRLYPEVKFPEFLTDCAAATAFLLRNAESFGGDPAQLFLMGHSAGAYNAAMLALNPWCLNAHGSSPERIAGVVGLAGPYDFLPLRDPVIKDIFSTVPDQKLTQPIIYASESAPPMFLAHGGADTTVLPRNTTALASKLRGHNATVETKIYPALGHIGMILALLPYLSWRGPVLQDSMTFIAACRAGEHAARNSEFSTPVVD
jgi:acetyl esterase/lipase